MARLQTKITAVKAEIGDAFTTRRGQFLRCDGADKGVIADVELAVTSGTLIVGAV